MLIWLPSLHLYYYSEFSELVNMTADELEEWLQVWLANLDYLN